MEEKKDTTQDEELQEPQKGMDQREILKSTAAGVTGAAALTKPPVDLKKLPFDPLEFIDFELPYEKMDPDLG